MKDTAHIIGLRKIIAHIIRSRKTTAHIRGLRKITVHISLKSQPLVVAQHISYLGIVNMNINHSNIIRETEMCTVVV